jgi:2-polyprenyl-3-methyl-5-hydroxy-6-metoxy-1,4-benzoquinol methylase
MTPVYSDPGKRIYSCGCQNIIDPEWQVERSFLKCQIHTLEAGKIGLDYHRSMGALVGEDVQSAHYIEEVVEPLQELGVTLGATQEAKALEIGCGVGVYVQWLQSLGYRYFGVEPDEEVAKFTRAKFGVPVDTRPLERFVTRANYSLVWGAHVFEHLQHAPEMLVRVRSMLNKKSPLVMIIPNDDDQVNPDHHWFFTPENLKATLTRIGFSDVRMTLRRRVQHEMFIYCVAYK